MADDEFRNQLEAAIEEQMLADYYWAAGAMAGSAMRGAWPLVEARCRLLEAERDKARAEALNEAAETLINRANSLAAGEGDMAQRWMRRHLNMAAQIVWNIDPPSAEEIAKALIKTIRDADARGLSVRGKP